MEETKKRERKTKSEKVADIEKKIAGYKARIATLEAKKEALLNPIDTSKMLALVKQSGLTVDQIAERLGVKQ